MARKNDLEVRPTQDAEDTQHVRARVESPSRPNDRDRSDTGENIEAFRSSEDDDDWYDGTMDAGSRQDELESEDAEDLAELINDASLSGANAPGTKSATKTSEGTLSRTLNTVLGLFTGSSQKPVESLSENNNSTSQFLRSRKMVQKSQVHPREVPGRSAALSGENSLARPNAIYEDISKMQKSRRSGRPDPYDVPQSPPRSHTPEPKPIAQKRQGPKSKRAVVREKPHQLAMAIEEAPASTEEGLAAPQEHVQRIKKVHGHSTRAIPASEERDARPKRYTRSTHNNAPDDLEEFQRQREKQQRKTMKESRENLQVSSQTQSLALRSKSHLGNQDRRTQAGIPASDVAEPQNGLQVFSKTKTQSKTKDSMGGRRDPQLKEIVPVTPTKRNLELEKSSAQHIAQTALLAISPILSGPTPAKRTPDSTRRLQRPSLVPKAAQGRKSDTSAQQLIRNHSTKSSASAQISEGAQDDISDDEDNTQPDFDVSTVVTPRQTVSNEDSATSFIDEETLEILRSTIQKAGEKSGTRVIQDEDYWTSHGKILTRGAARMILKYKAMKDLRSASVVDIRRIDMEHKGALKCLDIIGERSQILLSSRLGDEALGERNADKISRSHMLEDLYVYVIPGLIEALDCAVHSRQDQKALELSDLEEFYAILKILHDLVEASRKEDKTVQPKAPKTNSYAISQPTRTLRPTIKKLFTECGKKLVAWKMATKTQQIRKNMPDRLKKRKERLEEEQRKEEENFQQRLRERNRAIIASLDERRAELGLPPCSQSTGVEFTSQPSQTPKHKAEGPSDGAGPEANGRLFGVFGSRQQNSHPGAEPKEWSVDEMEILVDGLRRDRGPTRYEKLAPRLERSLDEIFDRAKYLKVQMEYTLKRLQEENPNKEFPPIKPWIENIGSEGFLNQ